MDLKEVFLNSMQALWSTVATFLPNLVAGILIIIVGYIVAKVAGRVAGKLVAKLGIDRASKDAGVQGMLEVTGVKTTPSQIIGRTVFLFILLVFIITAADTLGLSAVSGTIDTFILYLPKVIAAIVIGLVGLFFAQIVRDAIKRGTAGFGMEYANALSGVAHVIIIVVVATVAIGQLDIDTRLLHLIIGIGLGVAGIASAIALGMGTREIATNIVYGVYARDGLKVGERIKTGDVNGEVIEVGSVMTVVRQKNGNEIQIPNSVLMSGHIEVER